MCIWDVGTGSLVKCMSTGPEPVEILSVQMDIAAARIAMVLRFGEEGPVTARIQDIASEQVIIQVNAPTAISSDLQHAVLSDFGQTSIFDLSQQWQSLYAE